MKDRSFLRSSDSLAHKRRLRASRAEHETFACLRHLLPNITVTSTEYSEQSSSACSRPSRRLCHSDTSRQHTSYQHGSRESSVCATSYWQHHTDSKKRLHTQRDTEGASMDSGMDDSSHPTGRLACQACQRKKIKCDRTYPCGQCTRSNLTCTASTRKQRARHAGKRGVDSELKNRISKLESLVESLSGDIGTAPSSNGSENNATEATPSQHANGSGSAPSMRKYVASPFWTSLTSEVQALRDALEEDEPEGDTPESAPYVTTPPAGSELSNMEYDLIVCPPGRIYIMPGGFVEPTETAASRIFDAYLNNVEPIFRLYHTPTLVASMRDGAPYLGQPWDSPGNQALKRAVWMAGVNTMSEEECLEVTGENKADALNHYRRLVGISLAQADLVNTTDFATMQAFVTYLVSFTFLFILEPDALQPLCAFCISLKVLHHYQTSPR
jgi:hypothetical protein